MSRKIQEYAFRSFGVDHTFDIRLDNETDEFECYIGCHTLTDGSIKGLKAQIHEQINAAHELEPAAEPYMTFNIGRYEHHNKVEVQMGVLSGKADTQYPRMPQLFLCPTKTKGEETGRLIKAGEFQPMWWGDNGMVCKHTPQRARTVEQITALTGLLNSATDAFLGTIYDALELQHESRPTRQPSEDAMDKLAPYDLFMALINTLRSKAIDIDTDMDGEQAGEGDGE